MAKQHPFWKRILLNLLGMSMILAAPLLGWLPGPGGIPLFVAGLSLLSLNNEWAERLLQKVKKHTSNVMDVFFSNRAHIQKRYDIFGSICLGLAATMGFLIDNIVIHFIAGGLTWIGIFVLAGNKGRYKKLKRKA